MNAVSLALDEIAHERIRATNNIPMRSVAQSINKHHREELLRRYPGLKDVWAANEEYLQARERRVEAMRSANVPLRILAKFGATDGHELEESKSALHRLLAPAKHEKDTADLYAL